MKADTPNKPLWLVPWGLSEGFVIAAGLLIVAVLLEALIPFSILPKPGFPLNLLLFGALIAVLVLLWFFGRKSPLFQWLTSVKAAIPAIAFFAFTVILMGLIPQIAHNHVAHLGFFHILNSWLFFFSLIFFLFALGAATINRLLPFNLKNFTFFLNHFGLWICLAAGYLGSTDKQEVTLHVNRGDVVWYGETESNQTIDLPIATELINFKAQFHEPRIVLVGERVESAKTEYALGQLPVIKIDNLNIKVERYLTKAFPADTGFMDARGVPFAGSAVRISVSDRYGVNVAHGWLAYPTRLYGEKVFPLPDGRYLRLLQPEPAYFGSEVKLYSKRTESVKAGIIEVNAPMRIDGWWVYQYSYDNLAGADSQYSVFRAVFDPWMPLVYLGFILMLMGVIMMVFIYPLKFS